MNGDSNLNTLQLAFSSSKPLADALRGVLERHITDLIDATAIVKDGSSLSTEELGLQVRARAYAAEILKEIEATLLVSQAKGRSEKSFR